MRLVKLERWIILNVSGGEEFLGIVGGGEDWNSFVKEYVGIS